MYIYTKPSRPQQKRRRPCEGPRHWPPQKIRGGTRRSIEGPGCGEGQKHIKFTMKILRNHQSHSAPNCGRLEVDSKPNPSHTAVG